MNLFIDFCFDFTCFVQAWHFRSEFAIIIQCLRLTWSSRPILFVNDLPQIVQEKGLSLLWTPSICFFTFHFLLNCFLHREQLNDFFSLWQLLYCCDVSDVSHVSPCSLVVSVSLLIFWWIWDEDSSWIPWVAFWLGEGSSINSVLTSTILVKHGIFAWHSHKCFSSSAPLNQCKHMRHLDSVSCSVRTALDLSLIGPRLSNVSVHSREFIVL